MENLLENLIRVNGQNGGTIHQFIQKQGKDFDIFRNAYRELTRLGIRFDSVKAFDKLAAQSHIEINWGK